jgi:hypothetical protein
MVRSRETLPTTNEWPKYPMSVKALSVQILSVILMAGCTGPRAYRYANHVLIPPGVRKAEISARTVTLPRAVTCQADSEAVAIEPAGKAVRVTVKPAALRGEPAGWLENWTESLEQRGCMPVGDAPILAAQITEIVPLEQGVAFSLLHPPERAYVDLSAGSRLKAVGPLFREGAKPETRAVESVASDGGTLTVKASPDLVGVETAWYAVEAYPNRPGARIVFLSAEDRMGDLTTRPGHPQLDYLRFAPDAAFYRLFTITRLSQSNHDTLVLGASSQSQLDQETKRLEADPSQCAVLATSGACVEVPHDAALTKAPVVKVNGVEMAVVGSGTVRDVLLSAGVRQPRSILATLHVDRRYLGRLTAVEFSRADPGVLDLPLSGGEVLRW